MQTGNCCFCNAEIFSTLDGDDVLPHNDGHLRVWDQHGRRGFKICHMCCGAEREIIVTLGIVHGTHTQGFGYNEPAFGDLPAGGGGTQNASTVRWVFETFLASRLPTLPPGRCEALIAFYEKMQPIQPQAA